MPVVHRPAGTPEGGQFAPAGTASGGPTGQEKPSGAPDRETVRKWAKEWVKKLDDDEKDAIVDYTLNSDRLNTHLRSGTLVGGKEESAVENIDSALRKSKLPWNLETFRGLKHDPGWKPGQKLRDRGYTSLSLSESVAENFAGDRGAIIEIQLPKGSRGAYIAPLSPSYDSEAEFLLPRGSKFVVESVDRSGERPIYRVSVRKKTKKAGAEG